MLLSRILNEYYQTGKIFHPSFFPLNESGINKKEIIAFIKEHAISATDKTVLKSEESEERSDNS